ncbi:MAG: septation protein A [Pseudomonadota bacterium]
MALIGRPITATTYNVPEVNENFIHPRGTSLCGPNTHTADGIDGRDIRVATAKQPNGLLKLALELGPLVTFFAVNNRAKVWDLSGLAVFRGAPTDQVAILAATLAFMVATVIALCISLALYRKIPVMPLVSGIVVIVFGGLTLYLQNDLFIKMKPTIVNSLFAFVLLGGLLIFHRPLLKFVFDSMIELDDKGWRKLTLRWGVFFVFLAVLNEVIWRGFSTDFWVSFKVFGVMPITIVFALSQLPLMQRHAIGEEDGDEKDDDAPNAVRADAVREDARS